MFGFKRDVIVSLLGEDCVCDPPFNPDLHPSWRFVIYVVLRRLFSSSDADADADDFTLMRCERPTSWG